MSCSTCHVLLHYWSGRTALTEWINTHVCKSTQYNVAALYAVCNSTFIWRNCTQTEWRFTWNYWFYVFHVISTLHLGLYINKLHVVHLPFVRSRSLARCSQAPRYRCKVTREYLNSLILLKKPVEYLRMSIKIWFITVHSWISSGRNYLNSSDEFYMPVNSWSPDTISFFFEYPIMCALYSLRYTDIPPPWQFPPG